MGFVSCVSWPAHGVLQDLVGLFAFAFEAWLGPFDSRCLLRPRTSSRIHITHANVDDEISPLGCCWALYLRFLNLASTFRRPIACCVIVHHRVYTSNVACTYIEIPPFGTHPTFTHVIAFQSVTDIHTTQYENVLQD